MNEHNPEKVLYTARTHPKVLVKMVLIQIVLLFLHLILWWAMPNDADYRFNLVLHGIIVFAELYYVVIPVLRWWMEEFELTDRRLIHRWGILNKESRELNLNRIVSINEERDILDRIFGCGTLKFYSSAGGDAIEQDGPGVTFKDVPRMKYFRSLVENVKYGTPIQE